MRSKQPFHGNRKLSARTGVRWQKPFPYRHIQYTPKNSKLLVYRRGFYGPELLVAEFGFDSYSLPKTFTKIQIDRIRGEVHQPACSKCSLEVSYATLVRFVRFRST